MAINQIQFQKGMSLERFMGLYGTESQCQAALLSSRWSEGFVCPNCGGKESSQFKRGTLPYWQCSACREQTSLYAGTLFQHTRLPLTKWFMGLYFVAQAKTSIAALELRRHLGISWKAAWLLKHKLMDAMFERENGRPLQGDVVIDDAYLGGERTGGKAGRGSENKVAFIAAVEMRAGRPQRVRFDRVKTFSHEAVTQWAGIAVVKGSNITSDALKGFSVLGKIGYSHQGIVTGAGKAATEKKPFRWINTLLGNLKTSFNGSYHAFGFTKYSHKYLADVQYRFNRRFQLEALPIRILYAATHAKPAPARLIRESAEVWT